MSQRKEQRKARHLVRSSASSLNLQDKPTPPSSTISAEHIFKLIAYGETAVSRDTADSDDDLHAMGSVKMTEMARNANILDYGGGGEDPAFGNPEGLVLLRRLEDDRREMERISARLAHMSTKFDEQQRINTALNDRINSQDNRIHGLVSASAGFLDIRERFIDVCKEDVFGFVPEGGRRSSQSVQRGNRVAHEGDATADALLYVQRDRRDARYYSMIYGLTFDEVSKLEGPEGAQIISVLNERASILVSNKSDRVPVAIETAFQTFLDVLQQHPGEDILDHTSAVGRAGALFWKAVGETPRRGRCMRSSDGQTRA